MNTAKIIRLETEWQDICTVDDLVPYAGITALVGNEQIAIFYIPDAEPPLYVLDNWCPAAEANVLARGIVGDLNGELVVASPLYKEHFRLTTGECLEKPLSVKTWPVRLVGDHLQVKSSPAD